jgi:hypothetical protein
MWPVCVLLVVTRRDRRTGGIFLECVHCQTDRAQANDRDRTRLRKVLAGVRQRNKVKNGVDWHAYWHSFYNLVREALGYIDVTRNQTDRLPKVFRYIVVRNPY